MEKRITTLQIMYAAMALCTRRDGVNLRIKLVVGNKTTTQNGMCVSMGLLVRLKKGKNVVERRITIHQKKCAAMEPYILQKKENYVVVHKTITANQAYVVTGR